MLRLGLHESEESQVNINDQISVTLTAGEWNRIMQMLGTHPYVEVMQFINSIQSQCMQYEMNRSMENRRVSGQDAEP